MTKTVRIWRLEKNGQGAYMSCLVSSADYKGPYEHTCSPNSPPCPTDDREEGTELYDLFWRGRSSPYHFGFRSLAQYRRWFSCRKYRKNLAHHGGELVQYEVPADAVKRGRYQLAFDKSRAKRIATRSPAYA